MSKKSFAETLKSYQFSKSAKVTNLLNKGASDKELALAVMTTKAYKDSESLRNEVEKILETKTEETKTKETKSATQYSGEPPRR